MPDQCPHVRHCKKLSRSQKWCLWPVHKVWRLSLDVRMTGGNSGKSKDTATHSLYPKRLFSILLDLSLDIGFDFDPHCPIWIWHEKKYRTHMHVLYSQEGKTSVKSLEGDFSINNAFNPINLGAKWKLMISKFQNSPWMLNLELNWLRYDRETKPNFSWAFIWHQGLWD